jgi:hypothetical protein
MHWPLVLATFLQKDPITFGSSGCTYPPGVVLEGPSSAYFRQEITCLSRENGTLEVTPNGVASESRGGLADRVMQMNEEKAVFGSPARVRRGMGGKELNQPIVGMGAGGQTLSAPVSSLAPPCDRGLLAGRAGGRHYLQLRRRLPLEFGVRPLSSPSSFRR